MNILKESFMVTLLEFLWDLLSVVLWNVLFLKHYLRTNKTNQLKHIF